MNIEKDRVVSFHYRLSDEDGNALESSHEGSPMQYLHGHDGIIQGLEREMAGKAAGATFQ
ncbi:MAG: FKBP-type peptidyl-prolyl cis-trans isomerase, partial [Gammaproteobacteria bacterium]